jgi:FMN phosphatase YigB (HAD superfamily)
MKKLLILDFDQTISDTTRLKPHRSKKDWETVIGKVNMLEPYEGIAELVSVAKRRQLKIAIVTNLPDNIVEGSCKTLKIEVDFIVGSSSTKNPKPSFAPMSKALTQASVSGEHAIAIGDACIDTESARRSGIKDTIGATWGIGSKELERELLLSRPRFLCKDAREAIEVVKGLCTGTIDAGSKRTDSTKGRSYANELWLDSSADTRRGKLDMGLQYKFCRHRYNGQWHTCLANCLISDFKLTREQCEKPFFNKLRSNAIELFAEELSLVLPELSTVAFIPTSKSRDDPDYNDRFEILAKQLQHFASQGGKKVEVREPVVTKVSHPEIHNKKQSSESRKPESIMGNLAFQNEGVKPLTTIYIVDDVITSGGHFSAFVRILRKHCPNINVVGLFWTAHLQGNHPRHSQSE